MNINPYNQILDNMQRSEPLIVRYRDAAESSQAIRTEIEGKIDEKALHVLVYGAYNAGKSTLINLLLGEERAPVGDVPTTDRVDCYDWKGYRLLDTPGVNAPIEHERAAEDQLARTNAVVLVVREGDQDVSDVYVRLFSMMRNHKAIFIILNHQLGSAEEIVQSSKRIADILANLAARHGVSDTKIQALPIHPVNLKTALSGCMRGHDKLLEHSGFTRFVDAFADWTRHHDNQCHHLSEVKDTVKALWYDPVIANLRKLAEADGTSETEQICDMERTLVAKKNRMHGAGYRMVAHEIREIRPDIAELIRGSASKEEADRGLSSLLHPMFRKIEGWLNEELDEVDASIEVTLESSQMSELQGSMPEEANTGVRDMVVEKAGEIATDKETVKKALLVLRGTKAFGIRDTLRLKGRWTSTLDKWAGGFTKVAKGGLVFLQFAMAWWDAKRAHDRQEAVNTEMRRQAVESHQAIESTCTELRNDLVSAIDGVIEDTLGVAIVRVREQIEGMLADASERNRHYQQILDYRNRLEAIVFTKNT